jgi:hypothetical protein
MIMAEFTIDNLDLEDDDDIQLQQPPHDDEPELEIG